MRKIILKSLIGAGFEEILQPAKPFCEKEPFDVSKMVEDLDNKEKVKL